MMSKRATCGVSISAISSPALEDGASRCGLLAGKTTVRSGPEVAPVSLGRKQAVAPAPATADTSGHRGFGSSESAALQRSLESRLRAREFGSTVYSLTWKVWTTPAGRQICRLRASAPRKIAPGCGFWPTPRAAGGKAGPDYAKTERSRTGINLPTAIGGMPNPLWLAWLMGYPERWVNAAYSAMLSSRNSPPNLL